MTFIRMLIYSIICFFNSYVVQAMQADELAQVQEKIMLGHLREAKCQLQKLENELNQDAYTVTTIKGLQGYLALQGYPIVKEQNNDQICKLDYELNFTIALKQADDLLKEALKEAQVNSWHDLIIHFAIYLGQLNEKQNDLIKAQENYTLAIKYANQSIDKSLIVSALLSLSKLAFLNRKYDDSWHWLQNSEQALTQNSKIDKLVAAQLWLSMGYQSLQLYQQNPTKPLYLQFSYNQLQHALNQARQLSQFRTQALSLSYLSKIYLHKQRSQEAIKLLNEAVNILQIEPQDDVLFDIHKQLAEIYKAENNINARIVAHRAAINDSEKIREDIPISDFKEKNSQFYLDFADLLLQQARLLSSEQNQALLKEARKTIELIKRTELEDYFQSRCDTATALPINLKEKDENAAAIYPVALENRLEIIVETATGLKQFTIPVKSKDIKNQVDEFNKSLRHNSDEVELKKQALVLYQWLMQPVIPWLKKQPQKIETLIYIPDAIWRTIPLAALSDGESYLIENYAVVTSMGMSLIGNNPNLYSNHNILLAGLSRPSADIIATLSKSMLSDLKRKNMPITKECNASHIPDLGLTGIENNQTTGGSIQNQELSAQDITDIQEKLALPCVNKEITALAKQNDASDILLNENFSLKNFEEQVLNHSYKTLLIASHGFFRATSNESFIMAYDKKLTMDKLEQLLSSNHFRKHPIDLIILSACHTAEGDDKAPLGISGIAIKSKVHSALGSLWSVSDRGTLEFMTLFDEKLKHERNKAIALQEVQKLMIGGAFGSPYFWSPFILVGDWQ